MTESYELTGNRRSRSLTVSIEGLALALTRPIPVAILCAAALLKAYLVFSILPTRVKDWDFDLYYVSALALRENQNPYTVVYRGLQSTRRKTRYRCRAGLEKPRYANASCRL